MKTEGRKKKTLNEEIVKRRDMTLKPVVVSLTSAWVGKMVHPLAYDKSSVDVRHTETSL